MNVPGSFWGYYSCLSYAEGVQLSKGFSSPFYLRDLPWWVAISRLNWVGGCPNMSYLFTLGARKLTRRMKITTLNGKFENESVLYLWEN